MSPIGHLITASSMATALMRFNGISWVEGITSLPAFIIAQPSLYLSSSPGITLLSLGIILGARGPDRLEVPVFNFRTKVRRSLIPHRTLTHWPGFWIFFTLISYVLFLTIENTVFQVFACVILGFCISSWLHLLMDIMTPTGIPIITPFGKRTSLNLYKTASLCEWLCISIFVILSQLLATYSLLIFACIHKFSVLHLNALLD